MEDYEVVNPKEDITAPAIQVTINEVSIELHVSPTERVVDILRNKLGLTGTKISCGIGRCGACSILVDGKLMNSCLLLAYQVHQSTIKTIEGMKVEEQLHPIQQAFLTEGGFQCGYCTPGMIMAVDSLLNETTSPSETEIREALSGNLCRCTGYGGIIRAVQSLAEMKTDKS
ncbi:(2Fe-2S)-binding protein [Halobacillus salinarum]|uniref:(2Fe-2S)-binding protein n=1 Tax=Halobacillus salinarum TaxID=2932257 RepID=A0ABY4EI79_9BACI|nr:(2Fe-2S)-binding protein [Halobacillus salinarum]UOQ43700.1 (2Fe-2S)-binding protein [Halobacillus salinarum]